MAQLKSRELNEIFLFALFGGCSGPIIVHSVGTLVAIVTLTNNSNNKNQDYQDTDSDYDDDNCTLTTIFIIIIVLVILLYLASHYLWYEGALC